MNPLRFPRIEPLEARIAPATVTVTENTATYTDIDGDAVTVKTTRGTFTAAMFTTIDDGLGLQVQKLDISSEPTFQGAAITVSAKRSANGGDGFVNIGAFVAGGIDLASLTIPGDLGKIVAGDVDPVTTGLKTLTVQSMGRFGTSTQAAGADLDSVVTGPLGSFTVKSDVEGIDFFSDGGIGTLKIGGSLVEGFIHGTVLGKVTVGSSIYGGSADDTGRIFATLGITGPVTIGGSIFGGAGARSGHIASGGDLGVVLVKHDVIGGSEDASGVIEAEGDIKSVTIGGMLGGGSVAGTGSIVTDTGDVGRVTIGGSIYGFANNCGIRVGGALGTVKIAGDISTQAAVPVRITGGDSIASVTIGGSVTLLQILAGVDELGAPVNGDAVIGKVVVKGNWVGGAISAGVGAGGDNKFGTTDDAVIMNATPELASIGSITIGGEARGSTGGTDSYAFTAEKIGSVKFGRGKVPLTPGFDEYYIGPTFDLLVRELDGANPAAPAPPPMFGNDPLDISSDGKTARYIDADGDDVTIKTDKGKFEMANFTMAPGPQGGLILQALNLAGDADFVGKNASITFAAKPSGGAGDGFADVGRIDVSGANLNKLIVPGDVTIILGDEIKTLTIHSMAGRGFGTLAAPGPLRSDIGPVRTLTIATDLSTSTLSIDGDLGTAKIGGSIVGGGANVVGELVVDGNLKSLTIGHDMRGGSTSNAGRVKATGSIGSVKVGGVILGGLGLDSGSIEGVMGLGTVTVGGSLFGGFGPNSGSIHGHAIKTVTIGGNVRDGNGDKTGSIFASGGTADTIAIGAIKIGGSLIARIGEMSGIFSDGTLGAAQIGGEVRGVGAGRVTISAEGIDTPTAQTAVAIRSITIGGAMIEANIFAGYDSDNNATNADAQIGSVNIKGDFVRSNIVAGIDGNAGGFGDGDDDVVLSGEQADIAAKIASITIGGQAIGELGPGDLFAITAQEIGSLKIGSTKFPLSKLPPLDDLPIGFTGNLRVRELA